MVGTRRLKELADSVLGRLTLPEGPYVVALSGGADSAALAWLTKQTEVTVRALHVDHQLSGSRRMRAAAQEVAESLQLELDIRTTVLPDGPSPEGQARIARYKAFSQGADAQEAILTAHTRDDSVETVLLNLVRGTGPRGLAGIPAHRPPNIYRPLLAVTRAETRELAGLAELPFVDDPMNDDLDLRRNLVRKQVLPMLAELNPRLDESVTRLANSIRSDADYLDTQAGSIPTLHGDGSGAVAIGDLRSAPGPIRDRALKRLITETVGSEAVTSHRVDRLWAVATGEVASVEIGLGYTAERSGPMLVVRRDGSGAQPETMALTPGIHRSGGLLFDVLAGEGAARTLPLSRWAAVFAAGTALELGSDGVVRANGEPAWMPGQKRLPVAWYQPGEVGYLSVFAREEHGWTSSL